MKSREKHFTLFMALHKIETKCQPHPSTAVATESETTMPGAVRLVLQNEIKKDIDSVDHMKCK
jgi:hypothetical protein